jgi:uncharacterized membrane protein
MTYNKGEKTVKLRLLPLLMVLLLVPAVYAQDTSPTQLSFELYTDGVVRTDYCLEVDQTAAQVNITLFGESIEDLFIYDEEGLPLESLSIGDYYQVNTLGSSSIDVSYLTNDLTGKIGAIWSIDVETPISTEVTLPLSSTIINLNEIPLEIETIEDQTRLVMPAGSTIVSYTIYIQDSESIASEAIETAQTAIQDTKDSGIIVTPAEETLAEAVTAFDEEDYLTAQEKASETSLLTSEIAELEADAQSEIDDVQEAIQTAEDTGRTVGLDTATDLINEAITLHSSGDYEESVTKSQEALDAVLAAEAPQSGGNSTIMLGAGIVVVLVAAGLSLTRRNPPKLSPEDDEIDLELLFEEHPELRMDDREALRFMAEHGGEAFAHEVRDRIGIPRTSAWRMVQRLQRFEVIEEKKIGGQSLLSIVEQYRRKKK